MSRPHVPKYGNWAMGDVTSYTVYFDEAREGRNNTGKMINPNDPSQDISELFATNASQAQHKPRPPKRVNDPIERGHVRPPHEHTRSKENGEFKQNSEIPAKNENLNRRGAHGPPNSVRPVRKSVGSEHSLEKSHHLPNNQAKIAAKVGNSSPSRDGNDRHRVRPANRGRENSDRGAAVPIFGEWDEKNPSSAEDYTDVFNKVREERQSEYVTPPKRVYEPSYPPRQKYNDDEIKSCCFPWGRK